MKTARTSSVQASIPAAGGITRTVGPLANLAKTNTQTALQGQGSTSRGATLSATVSARVTDVLPNGYLVIEGIKHVQVNSENQIITMRGVMRPFDLDLTNSVSSRPHRANGSAGQRKGSDRIPLNGRFSCGGFDRACCLSEPTETLFTTVSSWRCAPGARIRRERHRSG